LHRPVEMAAQRRHLAGEPNSLNKKYYLGIGI